MILHTRATLLLASFALLAACGQKGPLYLEREAPPEVSTEPGQPKTLRRTHTTVEPASKENTSTELPPVIE